MLATCNDNNNALYILYPWVTRAIATLTRVRAPHAHGGGSSTGTLLTIWAGGAPKLLTKRSSRKTPIMKTNQKAAADAESGLAKAVKDASQSSEAAQGLKEAEVEKEKAREGEGPEGANKHLKSNKRQVKKLEDDAAPKHKKAQAAAAEPSKDREKADEQP